MLADAMRQTRQVVAGTGVGALLAATSVAFAVAVAGGCDAARFPTCKDNADCAARDAGPEHAVCFNLKCVQCRYDSDCDGGTCNPSNECIHLVGGSRPEGDGGDTPKGWEHGNWDQCAAECKDPACIKECDKKFQ